jgi:hypothetical protein
MRASPHLPRVVGSLFGTTFVTAGDVEAQKAQLLDEVNGLASGVAQGNLPPLLVAEFRSWVKAVTAFCQSSTGFWTAGNEADSVAVHTSELNAWQTRLNAALGAGGAVTIGTPSSPLGNVTAPAAPSIPWGTIALVGGGVAAVGVGWWVLKRYTRVLAFL